MPINPDAVGYATEATLVSWTPKDCMLYALGVGAGALDPTGFELEFTTDNTENVEQKVLPTFPVVVMGSRDHQTAYGEFDRSKLVHGEQSVQLHRPVPVEGTASVVATISGIYDKGAGAVVTFDEVARDVETGEAWWTKGSSVFIKGEGGFGGDRGPSNKVPIPEREPDHQVTYGTRTDQALLYRLSGDWNPLHSDPAFAARGGFAKPILHGLCTYGFSGRALLHTLCASDPARVRAMTARFSAPVLPGQDLTVAMWVVGDGEAVYRTSTDTGVVIDGGRFSYTG